MVKGINAQRRPASEMDQLYEETQASIETRQQLTEMRKMAAGARAAPARRPNKHQRKHIVRFKREQ
ncbi:MAG: heat-shock protein, partial [Gammaproteobacteria bacterium]